MAHRILAVPKVITKLTIAVSMKKELFNKKIVKLILIVISIFKVFNIILSNYS